MKIKIVNQIRIQKRKEKNRDGVKKQTILKAVKRKIIRKIITTG